MLFEGGSIKPIKQLPWFIQLAASHASSSATIHCYGLRGTDIQLLHYSHHGHGLHQLRRIKLTLIASSSSPHNLPPSPTLFFLHMKKGMYIYVAASQQPSLIRPNLQPAAPPAIQQHRNLPTCLLELQVLYTVVMHRHYNMSIN